jgi:predicted RNA-binding protein with PUA-like domain
MAYWLMKSEPDVNSWDDVVGRGTPEEWHGVRNYTARNNMKAMALGDEAFFYHSNIGKEIVGIMKVVALAHPDSTAEPNDKGQIVWECVDMLPVKPLPKPVTLATIKSTPELANMELVKLSRLSVSKVSDAEWQLICRMGGL